MDNRRYCKVVDGVIVEYNRARKDFGVGENSDESTCNARDYYLVVSSEPTYDSASQRVGNVAYEFDAVNSVVNKIYTTVDIPTEELLAKKKELVETIVQDVLDSGARDAGYDSIISACSYVGSTNFGTEAQSFLNWRDAVWTHVISIQAGTIPEPSTIEELVAGLPTRV